LGDKLAWQAVVPTARMQSSRSRPEEGRDDETTPVPVDQSRSTIDR
jgi:hypothetical protein